MGILDDAIRQHLELKRKLGAPPDEVERQEQEVFGPGRPAESGEETSGRPPDREPEEAEAPPPTEVREEAEAEPFDLDEIFDDEGPEPSESAIPAVPGRPEELAASADEDVDEHEAVPQVVSEPGPETADEPVLEAAAEPEATAEHRVEFDEEDEDDGEGQPAEDHGEAVSDRPHVEPISDELEMPRPVDEVFDDAEPGEGDDEGEGDLDEDVLEETPEFLKESEEDELWFEQSPPKDFDFDD